MKILKSRLEISGIPAVIWGEEVGQAFIAVHGNGSNKEDTVIRLFAEAAAEKGYQVLSFDLPQHGERTGTDVPCKVQPCVKELEAIIRYARERWNRISVFACSIGAYFSLIAYGEELLDQCLFLSPVVDMERIIRNIMAWFNVSPEQLEKEQEIETPAGQTLYWDYYCYVKKHRIDNWNAQTAILYGANDDLCEFDTIENFTRRFQCRLEVMEGGEHYFHTAEQLAVFEGWLKNHIK